MRVISQAQPDEGCVTLPQDARSRCRELAKEATDGPSAVEAVREYCKVLPQVVRVAHEDGCVVVYTRDTQYHYRTA